MRIAAAIASICVALSATNAAGQDSASDAKRLYASADYEQALTLLEQVPDSVEVLYYRALCLLALDRIEAAETQLAAMASLDPLFVPDPAEVSPRMLNTYSGVQRRVLPQIARDSFNEARRLYNMGDAKSAEAQFRTTVALLEMPALRERDDLADLKLVASGFLDLIDATAARHSAVERAPDAREGLQDDDAAGAAALAPVLPRPPTGGVVTPPVAIEQTLPPWHPNAATARQTLRGEVRVDIDPSGQVTAAQIVKPVHAAYDQRLLEAARRWRYRPATLNGVPTASEKIVEIELRPTR